MGVQSHAPAALIPGKTGYPLYRRLGGAQDRSGRVRKISPPPGFDPRTAISVEFGTRVTKFAISVDVGRRDTSDSVGLYGNSTLSRVSFNDAVCGRRIKY